MKTVTKITSSFCFLFALVLFSCNKADEVGDEIDKITIKFIQRFVDGSTEPYLLCTGGSYDCNGVQIAYRFDKTGEVLYLNFGDTYGGGCGGSYNRYPAHTYVYLGYLENGNYMFEISNKSQMLHCLLHVENAKYTITNGIGSTITFEEDPVNCNLVPADAVWGYVRSIPASNADYFLDSLQSLNAVSYIPFLDAVDYYYFRIINGTVVLNSDLDTSKTSFILKTDMDTSTLRNIMNYYCQSELVEDIHLSTGKGAHMVQY